MMTSSVDGTKDDGAEQKKYTKAEKKAARLVQRNFKKYKARKLMYAMVQGTWEKIFDPRRQRYYYYNKKTDRSQWHKPYLLQSDQDIEDVSPTYTNRKAALLLQGSWKRLQAKKKVAKIAKKIYLRVPEPSIGASYWFNPRTGWTSWDRPSLLGPEKGFKKRKKNADGNEIDDDDDESSLFGEDDTLGSETKTGEGTDSEEEEESLSERKRQYPRSKIQVILDWAKDKIDLDKRVEKLDLSNFHTTRISSRLYDITTLVELNISGNKLDRLSSDIGELKNLTFLDASFNEIKKLPVEMQDLTRLKTFKVNNNQLATFPPELYMWQLLEEADFSHNCLKKIPFTVGDLDLLKLTKEWEVGIFLWKRISNLYFNHNLIGTFPETIEKCQNLICLQLEANKLESIPNSVSEMYALEELSLGGNPFTVLNDNLGFCSRLKRLNLKRSALRDLDLNFSNLRNLEELYLDESLFQELPNCVGGMLSLQKLSAMRNSISVIPGTLFSSTKIESLHLDHNQLSFLPTTIENASYLKKLTLSFNSLMNLPAGLRSCTNLEELIVNNNKIIDIPDDKEAKDTIPIENLVKFDISYNQISETKRRVWACQSIEYLNLSHNNISSIPERIFNIGNCIELNLSFNSIQVIPYSFGKLRKLRKLYLHNNAIYNLPKSIKSIKSLRTLTLSNNELEEDPLFWQNKMPDLQHIDINMNPLEKFHEARTVDFEMQSIKAQGIELLESDRMSEAVEYLSQAAEFYEKRVQAQSQKMLRNEKISNEENDENQSNNKRNEIKKDLDDMDDLQEEEDTVISMSENSLSTHGSYSIDKNGTYLPPTQEIIDVHYEDQLECGIAWLTPARVLFDRCEDIRRLLSKEEERARDYIEAKIGLDEDELLELAEQNKGRSEPLTPEQKDELGAELDIKRKEMKNYLEPALVYLSKAQDLLEQSPIRDNKNVSIEVVFNKAKCNFMREDLKSTIYDLSSVLSTRPRYVPALLLMAKVREAFGQFTQARADVFKILYSKVSYTEDNSVKNTLEEVKKLAETGTEMLEQCGVMDPRQEQTYLVTPEGLLLRNRLQYTKTLECGRSQLLKAKGAAKRIEKLRIEENKRKQQEWNEEMSDAYRYQTKALDQMKVVEMYLGDSKREEERKQKEMKERKAKEKAEKEAERKRKEKERKEKEAEEERKRKEEEAQKKAEEEEAKAKKIEEEAARQERLRKEKELADAEAERELEELKRKRKIK